MYTRHGMILAPSHLLLVGWSLMDILKEECEFHNTERLMVVPTLLFYFYFIFFSYFIFSLFPIYVISVLGCKFNNIWF